MQHVREVKATEKIQLRDLLTAANFVMFVEAVKSMPKEEPSTLKRIGESLVSRGCIKRTFDGYW